MSNSSCTRRSLERRDSFSWKVFWHFDSDQTFNHPSFQMISILKWGGFQNSSRYRRKYHKGWYNLEDSVNFRSSMAWDPVEQHAGETLL